MVYITGIRVGLVRMGNMHLGLGRGLVSCALIVDAGYIVCKVDVDSRRLEDARIISVGQHQMTLCFGFSCHIVDTM